MPAPLYSPQVIGLLSAGRNQDQAGNLEAARQLYRQALDLEPRCLEAWVSLCANLSSSRAWDELEPTCLKALDALSNARAEGYDVANVDRGNVHYWLAQACGQQGRPEEAILELKLAVHYLPEHAPAHHELGLLCWEEGRLDEAVRYLARALILQYDAPDTLQAFNSAFSRWQTQAAQRVPQTVRDAFEKGRALHRKQHFVEALNQFQSVIRAKPDHAEAYCYMGLCQLALQDSSGLENVERAARIAPDNAEVLRHLARCYVGIGRLDEAVDLYKRVLEAQPTFVEAYVEQSRLYQYKGQWVEALDALKRARYFDRQNVVDPRALLMLCESWVKAEPQNAQAHYELALCYVAAENWPSALTELTTALMYGYGQQAQVYTYLGLALTELKDWNRAAQSLKSAIALQPDRSLLYAMLAFVYFSSKDSQQALAACEQAMQSMSRQKGGAVSAAYRRMVMRMINKIKHPSRDDQAFWLSVRRQIKSEVVHGI